jgi:hypothetical protein
MIKQCSNCSKEFKVKPSHYDIKSYCSRSCMAEHYKIRMRGEVNPNYRNGISRMKSVCQRCGKSFECHSYGPGRYCSKWCQNMTQVEEKSRLAAIRNANKPPKKKQVRLIHVCLTCGINVPPKTIRCVSCRFKHKEDIKNSLLKVVVCSRCGKSVVKNKWKGDRYCSIKCSNLDNAGTNNPNYRGGITPLNRKVRNSPEYKEWRLKVFQRDNYTCVHCGQIGWELHADHIKPFSLFPELRLDVDNGRTLCVECHKKTPTFLTRRRYEPSCMINLQIL